MGEMCCIIVDEVNWCISFMFVLFVVMLLVSFFDSILFV